MYIHIFTPPKTNGSNVIKGKDFITNGPLTALTTIAFLQISKVRKNQCTLKRKLKTLISGLLFRNSL